MKASTYIAVAIGLCTLIGLAFPLSAAAAEATVTTAQVIPPGGNACAPLQVINIHPYTLDNTLQSVDVTVNDPSYYVVIATVGNMPYTFHYVSRWNNTDGSMRQHLDVQTTQIGSSLPITLTLLSAKTGEPVCLSTISFSVEGTSTGQGSTSSGSGAPVNVPTTPATPVIPSGPTTGTTSTSTASSSTTSVVRGLGIGSLANICMNNGSLELWFLLITLYLIGAAAIALREPTVPERSLTTTTLLLVVPALILLIFWLFAKTCRGAAWVPVVLLVIAIASLLAALWEREPLPRMVELAPVPKKELLSGPSNTV